MGGNGLTTTRLRYDKELDKELEFIPSTEKRSPKSTENPMINPINPIFRRHVSLLGMEGSPKLQVGGYRLFSSAIFSESNVYVGMIKIKFTTPGNGATTRYNCRIISNSIKRTSD